MPVVLSVWFSGFFWFRVKGENLAGHMGTPELYKYTVEIMQRATWRTNMSEKKNKGVKIHEI